MKSSRSASLALFTSLKNLARHPKLWERVCVFGLSAALFVLFYCISAGPISWDELFYLDNSIDPKPFPFVLNRYFHIYLQRLFVLMSGDAMLGAKLFWSALMTGTIVTVYYTTKRMTTRHPKTAGTVAVCLLLFGTQILFDYRGITYVDYTAMFMVSLGSLVYLAVIENKESREHQYRGWMFVFGAILWFAFKTKEPTIILFALLPGFLSSRAEPTLAHLKHYRFVLYGVLSAMLTLMIVDWLEMGTFFFSIHPHSIFGLLDFTMLGQSMHFLRSDFIRFSFEQMPAFCILFALAGFIVRDPKVVRWERKLLWFLPATFILVNSVLAFNGSTWLQTRYLYPMLPIMSVWIAKLFCQALELEKDSTDRFTTKEFLVVFFLLVLGWITSAIPYPFAVLLNWNIHNYSNDFILPIVLTLIVAYLFWNSRSFVTRLSRAQSKIWVYLLGALSFPLFQLQIANWQDPYLDDLHQKHFSVLTAAEPYIRVNNDSRFFVSSKLWELNEIFCRGQLNCLNMFNVFFNSNLTDRNLNFGDPSIQTWSESIDYIFVGWKDFEITPPRLRDYERKELTTDVILYFRQSR